MKKEKKFSVRVLAEIAIFAAIALALDMLQGGIFRGVFLSGGSIGFAMVPIFIIAYRRGFLASLLCGFIVSLTQMLAGIYVINGATFDNPFMQAMGPFLQVMLDYVLAYTFVGFAGIFYKAFKNGEVTKKKVLFVILGTVIAGLLKYACHVVAGGLFWLGDGGDGFWGVPNNTWLYSFVYNGAYSIPNIIICTSVMVVITVYYPQLLDANYKREVVNEETNDNVEEVKVESEEQVNEKC